MRRLLAMPTTGKRLYLVPSLPTVGGRPRRGRDLSSSPDFDVQLALLRGDRLAREPVVQGGPSCAECGSRCVPRDAVVLQKCGEESRSVLCHTGQINEPEPSVKGDSTRALSSLSGRLDPVARPDDDRGEAINWYVRLLIQQAVDRGVTRKQLLMERGGIDKGHLSQIETGKLGMKFGTYLRFCKALDREPGQLLTEALEWWPVRGRQYRAKALEEIASRAKRKTESGEHEAIATRPAKSGT